MSKNYLIVGGSSGIGASLVQELNNGHNHLYLASRSKGEISGEKISFQQIDVRQAFELEIPERLDGVVYCPGTINLKPFHRLKEDDFIDDFKVNHLGAVHVIQQSLKALKKAEQASIVLFSSVAVQTGIGFHASIASAKGALEGLTRALAAEFAPAIRVNAVAPSLTHTPLAARLLSSEDKVMANAERHPLKAIGTPEDMSKAVSFLLSSDSKWVTGQVLTVDGGLGTIR